VTLKDRARSWLGIQPAPPPGKASPAGLHPPTHAASGKRLRISSDNPTVSLLSGLTLLAPFDPERRFRGLDLDELTLDKIGTPQLMELMADLSPEISLALWNLLRLGNPGWECKAYALTGDDVPDTRAQAALDSFFEILKERHGSADVIINRLFVSAFLRGAFMAELVLDNAGRMPLDIAVPDAVWTYFRIYLDPQVGPVWEPYQFQRGLAVSLMVPTVRYVPVDPLPASPYGRPMATPALFTALFTLRLLHDLARVVAQQGYPRIDVEVSLEELVKSMPPDLAADPVALNAWVTEVVRSIGVAYAALEPDDAFIHTDVSHVQKNVGAIDAQSLGGVGPLIDAVEKMAMRALKSSPLLMGLSGNSSESQANRQWEVCAAGVKSLQHLCEGLLEHLLTLGLQAQGLQARLQFRFSELRAAELFRDAQVDGLKSQNALFQYQAGWLSIDEACHLATGKDKSDQPEPRTVPQAFATLGTKIEEPGATVQPDPGANRAVPLAGVRGGNGNGKEDYPSEGLAGCGAGTGRSRRWGGVP
jgi:hypothetical protein